MPTSLHCQTEQLKRRLTAWKLTLVKLEEKEIFDRVVQSSIYAECAQICRMEKRESVVIPFLALARQYLSTSSTAPQRRQFAALSVSVEAGLGWSEWRS